MLHIANYMQNKDFNQITEIATVEDDQILKINARDGLTFFRLHHELDEINRKKDNFAKMKEKYFDKKDPKSLIHYDKELGDIVNNTEQAQQPDKKIPMPKPVEAKTVMSDKEKELVQTAVLKITIKKDKNEKNFYRDFLNGVQNLKEQNKKLEDEKNAQSHYHI